LVTVVRELPLKVGEFQIVDAVCDGDKVTAGGHSGASPE
jgi:hypothetical protein